MSVMIRSVFRAVYADSHPLSDNLSGNPFVLGAPSRCDADGVRRNGPGGMRFWDVCIHLRDGRWIHLPATDSEVFC